MVLTPSPARACDCALMTAEQSLAAVETAELIFEGRVVMLEEREQPEENFDYTAYATVPENPLYAKARLRILNLYKGIPDADRVEAWIDTMTDCGVLLQIGDVADFFLIRHDGILVQAEQCRLPAEAEWDALRAKRFLAVPQDGVP